LPRHHNPDKDLPTFKFERETSKLGAKRIAGIDEAGRGPLAGPVVAAAVVLNTSEVIRGLDDSKRLKASAREKLFHHIKKSAVAYGIGIIPPETIDRINILQATRLAMTRATMDIKPSPDFLLIDGPISLDVDIPQRPIIKGDQLSLSIAAAAILAKVTRDRIMNKMHLQYPMYGFDRHKGYGTKAHKEALAGYGPCRIHRFSFKGVKE
jgi:ribonuclease HII